MAITQRITKLRIESAADPNNVFRQWLATATVLDTPAGQSVSVQIDMTVAGATPPGEAESLTLNYEHAANVRSVTLNPTAASQSDTFFFTSNGTGGGAARCGTIEMKLRATRAAVVAYDVETDGSPNTPGAGFQLSRDQGWIRGTTTLVEDISNTSLGGAPSPPAEYDESLFVRLTAGAVSYESQPNTVTLSHGGVSGATNTTTGPTRDVTFASVCDERFPAGVTAVGLSVSVPVPVFMNTGQPSWVYTQTTDDTIDVDPRLTHTLHFQVDDDVFGQSKHDSTKQMLSTSSAFIWDKVTAARGTGKNGIGITQTLDPQAPGTTQNASATTSTQDGLAGVSGRMDWVASKPGGGWDWSIDVTSPADVDADTHEVGGTDTLTMLAQDPRIEPQVYIAPIATGGEDDHLHPGDQIRLVATLWNNETRKRLTPDAGTVEMVFTRYNGSLSRFEYLSSANVWTHWQGTTTAADSFALTDAGDGITFTRDFTSTSGWGTTDLIAAVIRAKVNSTPYAWKVTRELVKKSNQHSGYALDSIGLALSGVLSQR